MTTSGDHTPCSYEVVRVLQRRVEEAVGPVVDSQVEAGLVVEGDGHKMAAQITEEVFASAE